MLQISRADILRTIPRYTGLIMDTPNYYKFLLERRNFLNMTDNDAVSGRDPYNDYQTADDVRQEQMMIDKELISINFPHYNPRRPEEIFKFPYFISKITFFT